MQPSTIPHWLTRDFFLFCYKGKDGMGNNPVYWKLNKNYHNINIVHESQEILHSEVWVLLGPSGQVWPVHHTQVKVNTHTWQRKAHSLGTKLTAFERE